MRRWVGVRASDEWRGACVRGRGVPRAPARALKRLRALCSKSARLLLVHPQLEGVAVLCRLCLCCRQAQLGAPLRQLPPGHSPERLNLVLGRGGWV